MLMTPTKPCSKRRYVTEREAYKAARIAQKLSISPGWRVTTYQCPDCRSSTGRRAWHWGHVRPRRRRR